MPYLLSLDQWGQFEEDLSIYLASQKCSDVLKIIQVIPQEAPAGASLVVKKEALLKRVAYFDKQEMAFGLIAKSFSKCETKLTAECYKIDPTLKPGAAGTERPNGSRLFSTAKTYVLQNAAGGVYATYELKLKSLRLTQRKYIEKLFTKIRVT